MSSFKNLLLIFVITICINSCCAIDFKFGNLTLINNTLSYENNCFDGISVAVQDKFVFVGSPCVKLLVSGTTLYKMPGISKVKVYKTENKGTIWSWYGLLTPYNTTSEYYFGASLTIHKHQNGKASLFVPSLTLDLKTVYVYIYDIVSSDVTLNKRILLYHDENQAISGTTNIVPIFVYSDFVCMYISTKSASKLLKYNGYDYDDYNGTFTALGTGNSEITSTIYVKNIYESNNNYYLIALYYYSVQGSAYKQFVILKNIYNATWIVHQTLASPVLNGNNYVIGLLYNPYKNMLSINTNDVSNVYKLISNDTWVITASNTANIATVTGSNYDNYDYSIILKNNNMLLFTDSSTGVSIKYAYNDLINATLEKTYSSSITNQRLGYSGPHSGIAVGDGFIVIGGPGKYSLSSPVRPAVFYTTFDDPAGPSPPGPPGPSGPSGPFNSTSSSSSAVSDTNSSCFLSIAGVCFS